MPYLLQLVSPNDSAKVRKIFIHANFPIYTFNLFRILCFRLELRWPSDVNREATIFMNYCTFYNSCIYFLLPYGACSGSLRYFVCGAQPYPKAVGLTISTVIPRAAIIL